MGPHCPITRLADPYLVAEHFATANLFWAFLPFLGTPFTEEPNLHVPA